MSAVAVPGVSPLEARWEAREGVVVLSGIQALVRVMLDVRRRDEEAGHDTRVFVSGYQGSPLAGLDREMARGSRRLDAAGVVFRPGLNEELAATAVGGTQLLGELAGRRHDGVTGFWYGKNPGLDRAADAIRHANLSGTAPLGGAVALVGDDPSSKSSTVPSSCEPMCRSLLVPLLAPGTVAELLWLGAHAVALSRHAGTWSALKIVADLADASASVDLGALAAPPALAPRAPRRPPVLLPPSNLAAEEDLLGERLERAMAYARLAGLNRIVHEPPRPRLAVCAAGAAHQAVLRALADLGLGPRERDALGIRLVALGMPWPLERAEARRLLSGVDRVLVVEDKTPFLEGLVRDALYGVASPPAVLGREDEEGRTLLPRSGVVGPDDVARALGRLLARESLPEAARARLALLAARERPEHAPNGSSGRALPRRTPYFCSGCPHNASTRARPDELVGVGIGCHTMVVLDEPGRRGRLLGMPQMGGEGAQWLGLAPFADEPHFTQNLGDGTFHHSGSLAIRAAVAAGADMTFRLLYNDAVAMTGGQRAEGRMAVPDLTRWLALEGVRRTIVTTPDPGAYRGVALDPTAEVRHRDDLRAAQDELAATGGVTVLLHDERCATEERRLRRRGELPTPAERVVINERVCEGCGDCGDVSSCLSVQPVWTEWGRRTRIHQSSCAQDRSCLKGDCPSFLLVTPGRTDGEREIPAPPAGLPEPAPRVGPDVLVRMPGVGGTGVVTVSAILQMAAHLEGRHAAGLEQIGLAQKGGPVISDVRIARAPVEGTLKAGAAQADVLIGLDPLGAAAPETLAVCDPLRTVAVLCSAQAPTAAMVTDPRLAQDAGAQALRRVEAVTRPGEGFALDAAAIADRLFGDHLPANLVMLGAAFQHGCVPLSARALEAAIRLNGTAVEANLAAFAWGRAAVAAPQAVADLLAPPEPAPAPPLPAVLAARLDDAGAHGAWRRLLEVRAGELVAFGGPACAERWLDEVLDVARVARERAGEAGAPVAEAYARGLFTLTAFKDEYEVARLHLDAAERARVRREFGEDARVELLLHPPLLRALGLRRKLRLGPWAFGALRLLAAGRRVRGTPLDPFGHTSVRRTERALPGEYRALVREALGHLEPRTAAQVTEIAALADLVRGYEEIKMRGVAAMRERGAALLAALAAPPASSLVVRRAVPAGAAPPAQDAMER